ncbi:MAG: acetyl-CoA synthetase [Promethearchaeia archaeon]|nr:MAG: acetyl-CoA synthetase [Candidatus Lokiarchaeia archaeon]
MVKLFFYPKSIAIIGATEDSKKFGNAVTSNLVRNPKLTAKIYPVSRSSSTILGLPAYPSILKVPEPVDLALILVPAKYVPQVVDDCIQKQVKRIIIVTAGFGEVSKEGKEIERVIAEKCRQAGIRLIGPNCVGIQNVEIGMNASFIQYPLPGKISMVSQSGSFGCAIMDGLKWNDLGMSKFANIGNAVDVSFDEIIQYFHKDPDSQVVAIYLESVSDGKAFYRVMKEIAPDKPTVVLKGGRTAAGMAAAGSHTGSLASNYRVLKAAVEQAGGIICEDIEDYITTLKTFSLLPLPQGKKIGVLTNSGGAGVLYSDSAEELGLKLAEFSPHLKNKLKPLVIDLVQIVNPLDMIAGANDENYYQVTKAMLEEDSGIDIVIACGVYPPFLGMTFERNLQGMIRAWDETGRKKPLIPLLVFGSGYEKVKEVANRERVPVYSSPHEAAFATKVLIQRWNVLNRKKNIKSFN